MWFLPHFDHLRVLQNMEPQICARTFGPTDKIKIWQTFNPIAVLALFLTETWVFITRKELFHEPMKNLKRPDMKTRVIFNVTG